VVKKAVHDAGLALDGGSRCTHNQPFSPTVTGASLVQRLPCSVDYGDPPDLTPSCRMASEHERDDTLVDVLDDTLVEYDGQGMLLKTKFNLMQRNLF
jgi:hypothetical protein